MLLCRVLFFAGVFRICELIFESVFFLGGGVRILTFQKIDIFSRGLMFSMQISKITVAQSYHPLCGGLCFQIVAFVKAMFNALEVL